MNNPTEKFRAALAKAELVYSGPLLADGHLHRFKCTGDRERNS